MKTTTHTFWWRTKTFKTGLGIFIIIAVFVAVLFGDQISQLLDLFGSKAGIANILIVDDDTGIYRNGHGYLPNGEYNPSEIEYIAPIGNEAGYITLK